MTVLRELSAAIDDVDDELKRLVKLRAAYDALALIAAGVERHPVTSLEDVEGQLAGDPVLRATWSAALEAVADLTDPDPNNKEP